MRKALFILGCIASILLVADIGLTVAANVMFKGEVSIMSDRITEWSGGRNE